MPLPVLCFVLVALALVAENLVAENLDAGDTENVPIEAQVERHLESLQSDSPTSRLRAMHELRQLATETDSPHREAMIQTTLRYSLWSDLETQLSVDRLVNEIRILDHQEQVERLFQSSTIDDQQTSPLRKSWDLFSARASQDEDARAAFRQIVLQAGPALQWRRLQGRLPPNELDIALISHLGCLAPETPRLFLRQSRQVFSQLMKMQLHLPSSADANGRVSGRLIDRTLLDNPFGWTIPERLHLGLAYQRDKVAATLCDEVMRSEQPLARDLAFAMLAWRRTATVTADGDLDAVAAHRATAALDDRRVVCVSPERLVAENHTKNQSLHGSTIIRTRVQDVAGWVLIQRAKLDVRDAGMSSLRADPVWGTELSSIGFASEPTRARFLDWVQIQLAASE